MNPKPFSLFPEQASTFASHTDALFITLCALSIVVSTGIIATLFYFSIRYGRRSPGERVALKGQSIGHDDVRRLELTWSLVPLAIFAGIFWWGTELYVHVSQPPPDALTVYVVGKQWMWKTQHLGGQREINELHVPRGKAVKLIMTSEDVIHDFFVPAFRVKADVLPGRYTSMWFEATKVGEYHLFCSQYCGTKHSQMVGRIVVMEPADFDAWLGGSVGGTLAQAGEKRFGDLGCATCHKEDGKGRGPSLRGLFGSRVRLSTGAALTADEGYLRESILEPRAKVVAGYDPVMPTYASQLGEEGVVELIAYIKSLERAGGSSVPTADASDAPSAEPAASVAPSADASAPPSAPPSPEATADADAHPIPHEEPPPAPPPAGADGGTL
ncbi:MAG TPA: cytochrome c oxidase subunit II [Byssovorax sp.]